jgi:K(+)-stimulated pyrophosphate-energized sodium pump
MLKVITLVCALLGLFVCVIIEAWVRSRIINSDTASDTAVKIHDRSAKFWSTQYIPLILTTVITAVVIGLTIRRICAAAYIIGAVVSLVSVLLGTGAFRSGNTAAASQAADKNLRNALRTDYRSATVMGLLPACLGLLAIGSVYTLLEPETIVTASGCLALGASTTAIFVRLSGAVYSGASNVAAGSSDYADYSGIFAANGADWAETYLLAAASAALLAEVGVNTSGVTSTFTLSTAAKFPLIIYAAGILASIIGTLFFRTNIMRSPSRGLTVGNILSGLIVAGITAYFSNSMLQSYVYAWCVALGIAAGLIIAEISKLYTSDSKIFRGQAQSERSIRNGQAVITSMSKGMISVILPVVFITAAVVLSYNFASYYGIALSAAGLASIACINSTLRGYSINTRSTSEIIGTAVDEDMTSFSDILYSTSVRAEIAGKSYSAVSATLIAFALVTAFAYISGMSSADIISIPVLSGAILGVAMVFVYTGLLLESVSITARVIREKYNYSEDSSAVYSLRGVIIPCILSLIVPFGIGFLGGVNALAGFLMSFCVTGTALVFVFNNSGRYFENTASETLSTVIKLTLVISVVFVPVFTKVGSLFF